MEDLQAKHWILWDVFKVSLYVKAFDAVLEISAAIALLTVTPDYIRHLINLATKEELLEQPSDVIANYLVHLGNSFTISTEVFSIIYLFSHGAVKILLVIALLKKQHWAYPTAMAIFGSFALYEAYRYTHTHSPVLLVLMSFELFVIYLIWREYRLIRQEVAAESVKVE